MIRFIFRQVQITIRKLNQSPKKLLKSKHHQTLRHEKN
jgi:hypothetical protein